MRRMQQEPVQQKPVHQEPGHQEPGHQERRPSQADDRLAADWLTIWQSELAALAADPELGELRAALEALRLAGPTPPT